jgi:hypothetical protein
MSRKAWSRLWSMLQRRVLADLGRPFALPVTWAALVRVFFLTSSGDLSERTQESAAADAMPFETDKETRPSTAATPSVSGRTLASDFLSVLSQIATVPILEEAPLETTLHGV